MSVLFYFYANGKFGFSDFYTARECYLQNKRDNNYHVIRREFDSGVDGMMNFECLHTFARLSTNILFDTGVMELLIVIYNRRPCGRFAALVICGRHEWLAIEAVP